MRQFFNFNYKFIIFFICTVLILTYPMPYIISNGGGISDLSTKFVIENSYKSKGSFNLSYVSQVDATVSNYIISLFFPSWEREKASDYQVVSTETIEDINTRSRLMLKMANQYSVINAYEKAGKEVNITNSNYYIMYILNNKIKKIKIGDIIKSVNGAEIKNFSTVREEVEKSGKVTVTVLRDDKEITEEIEVLTNDDGDKYIGLGCYQVLDYEVKPEIKFTFDYNESGGSAGLMTTLAIYNALVEEDITHGLKIAGTGTINFDGSVGEIAGVNHKLDGAVYGNADLFFVPKGDNYEEALKVKKQKNYNIKIIPVESFEEALNYLENYKK